MVSMLLNASHQQYSERCLNGNKEWEQSPFIIYTSTHTHNEKQHVKKRKSTNESIDKHKRQGIVIIIGL